jgi:hypothetical protein
VNDVVHYDLSRCLTSVVGLSRHTFSMAIISSTSGDLSFGYRRRVSSRHDLC